MLSVMLLIVGIVLAVFTGYRQTTETYDTPVSPIGEDSNARIAKVHQTATKDGETVWNLNAASVKYIETQKKAFFRDISVTFFLKDGNKIYLTADEGVLNTDSNDIEINGNVVVKNATYQLATENISYQDKKRFIFSKTPVKITGHHLDLTAESMSIDLHANRAWFKGNVEGSFNENATL